MWLRTALTALFLVSCAELEQVGLNVCGNGVIEAGEDCDTIADPALGKALLCGDSGASACRYVCGFRDVVCPAGWACGDDGVCRHASGCFEREGLSFPIGISEQSELGDVSGDGRADLVIRSGGDLSLFLAEADGAMTPAFQASISNVQGPFELIDLDGDEQEDLLIAIKSRIDGNPGLRLFFGTQDGFTQASFPTDSFRPPLLLLSGQSALRAHEPAMFAMRSGDSTIVGFENGCGPIVVDGVLPDGELHRVPTLDFGPSGGAILALALRDTIVLLETSPGGCLPDPLIEIARLPLPAGSSATGSSLHFVTFPGEQASSLLATVSLDVEWTFALYGWTPSGWSRDERFQYSFGSTVEGECASTIPPILDVADFDGDGYSDLVTSDSISVWASEGIVTAVRRDRGAAWLEATVEDFDGNGTLDVVAVVVDEEDHCRRPVGLDFIQSDGRGSFVTRRLSGVGAPRLLRSGDFDGDLLRDVVVVDGTGPNAAVVVLYGAHDRALSETTRVEGLGAISAISALRYRTDFDDPDRISDVSVVASAPDVSTLLEGGSDRTLSAPLILGDLSAERVSMIAGPILAEVDPPEHPEVLMRVDEQQFVFDPMRDGVALQPRPGIYGPLDVIGRCPSIVGGLGAGLIAANCGTIVIARNRADGWDTRHLEDLYPDCAIPSLRSLSDLDGDGALDALITLQHVEGTSDCEQHVLAAFDLEAALAPAVSPSLATWYGEPGAALFNLQAAVPLNADADPGLEIAVHDLEKIRLIDLVDRHLVEPSAGRAIVDVVALEAETLELRRGLLAGDVDGDGLTDLVQLDGETASVHLALAHDDPAVSAREGEPLTCR